jgi:beta-glucuronidase
MKKSTLSGFNLAFFCFALFAALAAAQGPPREPVPLPAPAPLIQNALARSGVSLNGDWHYFTDPYDNGGRRRYFLNQSPASGTGVIEYDFAANPTLHVPGDWNTQSPEMLQYEGTVWYEKSFDYHPRPGWKSFFYAGAANYRAQVWVNGKPLCAHEGGFTPFNCDATSLLQDGANFVVIAVNDTRHADDIPSLQYDWFNYGGLTHDVRIVEVPENYIEDYSLQLQRGAGNHITGWIRTAGSASVTVDIPELRIHREVAVSGGKGTFDFDASGLQRWSPENPKLYDVTLSAGSDRVADQIGFRTVEVRGTDILLNGKPIFLRGINMHDEAPTRAGRAHGDDDARTSLGWAKDLGCNFIRLAHYPHDEHTLRMADRMGLLVWSEIPLWQGIAWTAPGELEKAKHMLTEEVARDHNRAAIIFWSISNETTKSPERNALLHDLAAAARALDDTRLITSAVFQPGRPAPHTLALDDPLIADLDVIGVNEYIGWYEGVPADADVTTFTNPFGKPVIVSEFGGDAKQGLHGAATQRWTEEYQEDIYKHQLPLLRKTPFIRGTAPWILKDFRSPTRHLPGIQDGFNRKGLVSNTGEKKKAWFVMQQFYADMARGAAK